MLFAVIGLGVFGRSAAIELQSMGNTVIGVDIDAQEVDRLSDALTHCVIADATDRSTLEELNLTQCDGVLVSIGDNLEASVLCTLNLRDMGVHNVWVKAKSDAHHAILSALNVRRIVHPEQDMGKRIAQAMNYPMVLDHMALGDGLYVIHVLAKAYFHGRNVREAFADLHDIDVFMVKRGTEVLPCHDEDFIIKAGDHLLLGGTLDALRELSKTMKSYDRAHDKL
ncbi:TrkA family potassium uptake protein [Suttonella sp. R2A3]|uniref:potassium channel family protein n=1 Tax=Suttonella sp. R2A3 TaxID=2908648 RepID=UPI001F3CC4B9|nr:TrkA family potassium uptake protein [Suttonella sp. R2A3]UJF24247.1 TrkA family potassium uptake protein [Suttonella sp. R2A3]